MNIVHSALREINQQSHLQKCKGHEQGADEKLARHLAYQTVCAKYRTEIKAIQKYFPGWVPTPPVS